MKTDVEKHDLHGPVKSVHVETAEFKDVNGHLVEEPRFGHSISFNGAGQMVEQIHRNPDGSIWRTLNDYSEAGNLLATKIYDSSGQLASETIYVYDAEGRIISEQFINKEGHITTPITYVYDGEDRKTKTQILDFAGEANVLIGIEGTNTVIGTSKARRIVTRYDERGNAVEVATYDTDDVLVSRIEIRRDSRGQPLEEIQYNGDAPPFGQCSLDSCATEEQVTLTEEQRVEFEAEMARMFAPGTTMSRHTHQYDERGRLIESILTMMGMNAGHQTFAYDEFGNKSEEASYDEDGRLQSKAVFTREYDERSNWIKEVVSTASAWDAEFGLSTPQHVTRRTITYYSEGR